MYALSSFVVLLLSGVTVGWWLGHQIRERVVHRAGVTAALYVENFVAPHLQALDRQGRLPEDEARAVRQVLSRSALEQEIVSIKLWAPGGRQLYGQNAGRVFPVKDEQARAWRGEVVSSFSDLDDVENVSEGRRFARLIETYAPIRADKGDRVIAVAEFYQAVDALERDIRSAQWQTWGVVALATIATYLLLSGLVRRGSDTITRQQRELTVQVAQLDALVALNAQLHDRVRLAATRSSALNERFVRRMSSELHDGPAQELGYALLRLERIDMHVRHLEPVERAQAQRDVGVLKDTLQHAMHELRTITAELRLPELEHLDLRQTIERAARDHRRRTGTVVEVNLGNVPGGVPLPVKMTAFRIIREALTNAYRHAGGMKQHVHACTEGEDLYLEVSDGGPGFDVFAARGGEHLGLVGMEERTRSLGGTFEVKSGPDGTTVKARLPLRLDTDDVV
ncbi:sensor histidine kinase [Deinococcus pimensis]|uniref:sensor histidine kinase n=1 Tax=Deinococcus pimensis TaxID=309888 RepID=UPI0004B4A168|nr:sensor histidine kinase [Deinococcus pimensis]